MSNIHDFAADRRARDFVRALQVGDRVTTTGAFTSATGAHFSAGDVFVVDVVGTVNVRAHAERCGSAVWLAGGGFVTAVYR